MLVLCPTADYEIYLGRNRLPAHDVLFEPTRKLLEVWGEFDIKGTLFPDVCSVWRHRECGLDEYADSFEAQIIDAAQAGHDIQLHLHTEWRLSEHREGEWEFSPGSGSLHDLGFDVNDPDGAPALIRKAKSYLEEQLRPTCPEYKCVAFRAGGWVLQPEGELITALQREGITIDASVIPGVRLLRTDYNVDFRRVPDQTSWRMNPQLGLAHDSGSTEDLLEVSIAAYRGRFPIWQHVINEIRLRRRAKNRPEPARGQPIVTMGPKYGLVERIKRKYRKLSIPRVLDLADTFESMHATLRSYLGRYDCEEQDYYVCMNGHPKNTYDYHLLELQRFLGIVTSRYASKVRFATLDEIDRETRPNRV